MNILIACCGIDCANCDARKATIENDLELKEKTAEKWRVAYHAEHLTAEMINCTGCRADGAKFQYCSLCEIRNCVNTKGFQTCGECSEMSTCQIVQMVHQVAPEAIENLKN